MLKALDSNRLQIIHMDNTWDDNQTRSTSMIGIERA